MRKLPPNIPRPTTTAKGLTGTQAFHDSAWKHVRGQARYIDDLPEPAELLHAAVGQSTHAHARITAMDLSEVWAYPGVVSVMTVEDVPGHTDIGPVFPGDPVLAGDVVEHVGQPLFAVAATSHRAARQAARLAKVSYEPLPAALTAEAALDQQLFVRPSHTQLRGDPDKALAEAPNRLQAQMHVGGQEHFYLEGQACLVEPTEDAGVFVHTSSQHPSEVQKLVAEVLDLPIHEVQVEVRRMGGGFGGKETQAAPLACISALLARRTGRPVKYRMARYDDMVQTGKRHDFFNTYDIGFDNEGVLRGADIMVAGRCGFSPDLSDAIVDRAMFHSDNAYSLGQARVVGHRCKTHTVSNTAFRGFGGPQGMMIIERAMDDIARHLGMDPLDVRKRNLYGPGRDVTHYGQIVEQHVLPDLIDTLEASSDYRQRRTEISRFNKENSILKRGLALTPVKFGISFTAKHLNQAGALVHVYTDGSIHLNHGGTEMGQGLYIKVAQVVAAAFQVDLDRVKVSATRTDKVPNTSPTAASSGTDLNGMAALDACEKIKQRLVEFAAETYGVSADSVRFENNQVNVGEQQFGWAEFVQQAYMARVSLSSNGFYSTPKIHYDRETGQGRPFLYYANGAACAEVVVDTLTGEYKTMRVDILHDVGQSLNPAVDIGQIEGGFVQGMGWLTTEELVYSDEGRLLSNGPATYKIPAVSDAPPDFRVALLPHSPNREATVFRSKAVGEPPLMLGMAVWSALRDAVSSVADYRYSPPLDTPATPERVLQAVTATERWVAAQGELVMQERLTWIQAVADCERRGQPYVLVTVLGVTGSVPREPASKMVVTREHSYDTIGGGHLEYRVIARARERLANHEYSYELAHFPLGASLGQCCGGSVAVLLEAQSGGDARLVVFGAGHVSHALMRIVGDLPWQITWVDSRQECFPDRTPDNTTVHCTDDPVGDVPELCSNAHVLILTHNHALDYDLCQALLKRDDVRTIGLIGSQTKAERFRQRLAHRGYTEADIDRIRCPVGRSDIPGKRPMEVAVSISAELLSLVASDTAEKPSKRGLSWGALKALTKEVKPNEVEVAGQKT